MTVVRNLKTLRSLRLTWTRVGSTGLAELKSLPALEGSNWRAVSPTATWRSSRTCPT